MAYCYALLSPGRQGPFQYKYGLPRYGDSRYKDKAVVRPSYLYNGNSYTGRTRCLSIETSSGTVDSTALHSAFGWCKSVVSPVRLREFSSMRILMGFNARMYSTSSASAMEIPQSCIEPGSISKHYHSLSIHLPLSQGGGFIADDSLFLNENISCHYIDVITTTVASQITSLTAVYSTVYSDADQRKHQSSASLAFLGIHRDRWIPRTKGQLRGKCFHLTTSSCIIYFY